MAAPCSVERNEVFSACRPAPVATSVSGEITFSFCDVVSEEKKVAAGVNNEETGR